MSRINEAVRRILTLKFQLGLFDQPCVSDPSTPCVDASAANAAVTAGPDGTLQAARESITLLRNQNNTLPLSSTAKVVVTGPSADSMTNQLGGWSVSWQGVFGAGHVCCMGPPESDPAGHHRADRASRQPTPTPSTRRTRRRRWRGRHGERLCRRGGREGLRRGARRQSGAAAAAGSEGADQRAARRPASR